MTRDTAPRRSSAKVISMPVVHELREAIRAADTKATEAKAEIGAHERECALRYAGIETQMTEIKTALSADRLAIAAERVRFGKFVWSMVGALALLVASLIGWLLIQLYTLEPLRVQAAEHKALAAVSAPK